MQNAASVDIRLLVFIPGSRCSATFGVCSLRSADGPDSYANNHFGPWSEELYLSSKAAKSTKRKSHVCCLVSVKANDGNFGGDLREDALLSSCPVHSNPLCESTVVPPIESRINPCARREQDRERTQQDRTVPLHLEKGLGQQKLYPRCAESCARLLCASARASITGNPSAHQSSAAAISSTATPSQWENLLGDALCCHAQRWLAPFCRQVHPVQGQTEQVFYFFCLLLWEHLLWGADASGVCFCFWSTLQNQM